METFKDNIQTMLSENGVKDIEDVSILIQFKNPAIKNIWNQEVKEYPKYSISDILNVIKKDIEKYLPEGNKND
jgi:hypothetical protein